MDSPRLLVSDIDNTMLGDDSALARFAEWLAINRARVRVAYASGRLIESIQQSVRETALPEPDAMIGGVGTEIRLNGKSERVAGWPDSSIRWDANLIRGTLASLRELTPQPALVQTEFKISYFGDNLTPAFLRDLKLGLETLGQAIEVVYSSNRDLDVLPAGTNKGSAAVFLADLWEIPHERVIVAGDSGNDLAMFCQSFHGIVIANAHDVIKSLQGARIYHSPDSYAAGVLDGMKFWMDQHSRA